MVENWGNPLLSYILRAEFTSEPLNSTYPDPDEWTNEQEYPQLKVTFKYTPVIAKSKPDPGIGLIVKAIRILKIELSGKNK